MFYRDEEIGLVNIGEAGATDVTGQHSGNPGDSGVQLGYHFEVLEQAPDGSAATVRLWNRAEAVQVRSRLALRDVADNSVTVYVTATNLGAAAPLVLYSDFDEDQARYGSGSTNGALSVRATLAEVHAAVRAGGPAALQNLLVLPEDARAVAWAGAVGSGETASFRYVLLGRKGYTVVSVTSAVAVGEPTPLDMVTASLSRSYLPLGVNRTIWWPPRP
jgi:hypothetical protein